MSTDARATLTDDDIETVWPGRTEASAEPQDADGTDTDTDEADADGTDGDADDSIDGDADGQDA